MYVLYLYIFFDWGCMHLTSHTITILYVTGFKSYSCFFVHEPHTCFCMASSCTSTLFRVSRATSVFNIEPGE